MTPVERLAVLKALAPALPLWEPRPSFAATGRGAPVMPRVIAYQVSSANGDFADVYARTLGVDEDVVHAQIEADMQPGLRIPEAWFAPERRLSFEMFAAIHDDGAEPEAVWWWLSVPLVNLEGTRALILATLGGLYGAEDAQWLAERGPDGWRLVDHPQPG